MENSQSTLLLSAIQAILVPVVRIMLRNGIAFGTFSEIARKVYADVAFAEFKPGVILASAGFDAHADDDMSDIKLSTEGFSWIARQLVDMANRSAQGRLVSILEGGYSLKRLPELARNHVEILLND